MLTTATGLSGANAASLVVMEGRPEAESNPGLLSTTRLNVTATAAATPRNAAATRIHVQVNSSSPEGGVLHLQVYDQWRILRGARALYFGYTKNSLQRRLWELSANEEAAFRFGLVYCMGFNASATARVISRR